MRKRRSHRLSHLLPLLLLVALLTGGCLNTNDDEIADVREEVAALREELAALPTAAPSSTGRLPATSTPTDTPTVASPATATTASASTALAADLRAPLTTPEPGRVFVASFTGGDKEQTVPFSIEGDRWVLCSDTSDAGSGFFMRIKVRSTESAQPVVASLSVEDTEFVTGYPLTGSGRYFLDVDGNFNRWTIELFELTN